MLSSGHVVSAVVFVFFLIAEGLNCYERWKRSTQVKSVSLTPPPHKSSFGPELNDISEDKLTGHSQIAGAVVFGQGRSRLGVVLELKPEFAFGPDDSNMLSEFRAAIWYAHPHPHTHNCCAFLID